MLRLSLPLILLSHSAYSMLLGWVESPGYPSGYQPHASLNWSRCAPKGHTLSIRLMHLDLEDSRDCENDGVKISSNGSLISVLCGKREFEELQSTVNPLLISPPGGCLSLSFYSDYSNTKRYTGFRGFYTVQDFNECDNPENGCTQFCHNFVGGYHCSCRHGYHLAEDKHTCTVSCSEDLSGLSRGHVASPSWPGEYAENSNCQYTLSVEAHLQLELLFSEVFDVEQAPDGQCIDALTIETHSGSLGPFCGQTPPPSPLLTHSHHLKIHFTSDSFGTNKGFSFHFQTTGKVCPAVVTSHSTVVPEKPEHHPGQILTVTCELGYVLNIQGTQTLETQYETTCLSTGEWLPKHPCQPVNCGHPDIPEDSILQLVGSDEGTHYEDQIQFSCSSKYYTLEGEDTYTCSATGDWETSDGEKKMPKCNPVCGMPDVESLNTARILGGENAKLGEIPWQLLIRQRGGASLINDRWAVTAAHVVEGLKEMSLQMYGGLVDAKATNNRPSDVVSLGIERIIIHPGYSTGIPSDRRTDYDNDIALIRLASRVNLGPKILPICLPESDRVLEDNEQGSVSGFGRLGRENIHRMSQYLKYAHIGVYPRDVCLNTPQLSGNSMKFTENMICAGGVGKDSCQKDSGGPFVVPMVSSGNGPYYLFGIVSWGPPCEQKPGSHTNNKGYYTRVKNYVDWIKETINQVENSL